MDIDNLIDALAKRLYDRAIMDNRERGDFAEQLVASVLEPQWTWVGLGWHPWDFQRGSGRDRVRLQVKQSAMKQVWKRPARPRLAYHIPQKPKPRYFEKYWENEAIEAHGHFCDLFVFAWHGVADDTCDHRLASQWDFFIVPRERFFDRNSISLQELAAQFPPTKIHELGATIEQLADQFLRSTRKAEA